MFIETSSPQVSSDRAYFLSTVFDATAGTCFTFWYHMYGDAIGELAIYVGKNSAGRDWEMMWYLAGAQSADSTDWLYGQFAVISDERYQVCLSPFFYSSIVCGSCMLPKVSRLVLKSAGSYNDHWFNSKYIVFLNILFT